MVHPDIIAKLRAQRGDCIGIRRCGAADLLIGCTAVGFQHLQCGVVVRKVEDMWQLLFLSFRFRQGQVNISSVFCDEAFERRHILRRDQ